MGATIWAVAVATAGLPDSGFSGGGIAVLLLLLPLLSDLRFDVETAAEGAAAMIGTEGGCGVPSAAVPELVPFPPVFTGAESVAKELGDPMTL
jgi:hypothetical protein